MANDVRLNTLETEVARLRIAVDRLERELEETREQRDAFRHYIATHPEKFPAATDEAE